MSRASWTPHDPLWRQVWVAWRRHGWRYVWRHHARGRLLARLHECLTLIEFRIPLDAGHRIEPLPRPLPLEIRELPAAELFRLRAVSSRGRYRDYARFAWQGFRCYVAEVDGRIVGYNWYAFGPYRNPRTGITFSVEPGEAYLVYSHTLRAYRGRGVDAALKAEVLARYQRAGVRAVLTVVEHGNRPSLRGVVRCGGVPIRRYEYERWGWRRRSTCRPMAGADEPLRAQIGPMPRLYNLPIAASARTRESSA